MLFTWDSNKGEQNVRKHSVSFEIAQTVFDDPLHISVPDAKSTGEERWITLGQGPTGKMLVVVHTYHEEKGHEMIRIISARRATRKEIKYYEEGI